MIHGKEKTMCNSCGGDAPDNCCPLCNLVRMAHGGESLSGNLWEEEPLGEDFEAVLYSNLETLLVKT